MQFIHIAFYFILGTMAASFFHVVILRMHAKRGGIIAGRSECTHCKHLLNWYDLVPVVSYLSLSGKCRYCKEYIGSRYLLIEILTGTIFAYLAYTFPFEQFPSIWGYLSIMAVYIFFVSILILIAFYDWYYYIIPDQISLPAISIALAMSFFPFTPSLSEAFFGALIPFTFFVFQIVISKGKWIGGGDLRLALFMGIILGPAKVVVALFIAYLIGSIVGISLIMAKKKSMKERIPFGPFLCIGTFIALFWGQQLIDWYFGMLGL